jgi:hypothetical protein
MAVTEQQRHRLLAWFEEQMGHDLGATMMELLPPADGAQLVTKADLALTTSALRSEIAELRTELRTDLADFRAEWKSDLLGLQQTFVTWLIASQAAVITAIGIATGLVIGLS